MSLLTGISSLNLGDVKQWSPLDKTLGVYLLGTFIGLVYGVSPLARFTASQLTLSSPTGRLYGISLHQMYRYYRLFPSDPRFIRILVRWSCILCTSL